MLLPLYPGGRKRHVPNREHEHFCSLVFAAFLETGEWPVVEDLQRELYRRGDSLDISIELRTLPPELVDLTDDRRTVLNLGALIDVGAAADLLDDFMTAVRLARDVYRGNGEAQLTISALRTALGNSAARARRTAALMDREPDVFLSASPSAKETAWDIAPSIRHFDRVRDIHDYLAAQERYHQREAAAANRNTKPFWRALKKLRTTRNLGRDLAIGIAAATIGGVLLLGIIWALGQL